jgi:O-methyltransferase involved in polyketide biosynthesis
MTAEPSWLTADANVDEPSIARLYDYLLGGTHNLEIDRKLARKVLAAAPGVVLLMRENRKFLRRMVRHAVESGVDQFLDIGAGIPTRGSVHETAQSINPNVRIAYIDVDHVAIAHGAALLADNPNATSVLASFLDPKSVLDNSHITALIDLNRPVAVLILNLIHFFSDDKVLPALAEFRDRVAPGSLLAISTATGTNDLANAISDIYLEEYGDFAVRTREQILALFGDFELLEPGLVFPTQWRPERNKDVGAHPERYSSVVGVARKTASSGGQS